VSIKIAFTSCADAETDPDQQIWATIAAKHPDYVLFLGDLIYMDFGTFFATNKIRKWSREGDEGCKKFASAMYERYKKQWTVATFHALLMHLGDETKRRQRLHCTWDNHDFAWNGACGEAYGNGTDEMHEKFLVPPRFKTISKRLFEQFVEACYGLPAQYPALDGALCNPALTPDTIGIQKTVEIRELPKVYIELLDTRWYRQVFVNGSKASLLGEPQLSNLIANCSDSTRRMTIIASSVPYQHDYRKGNAYELMEGWSGNGISRIDYGLMQAALAQTPSLRDRTIFVSGDIHKNEMLVTESTTLRQLSSSPVVKRGLDKTCFGMLILDEVEPTDGRLKCRGELFRSNGNGYVVEHTAEWSQ
jgi:alkaline phosphatase D